MERFQLRWNLYSLSFDGLQESVRTVCPRDTTFVEYRMRVTLTFDRIRSGLEFSRFSCACRQIQLPKKGTRVRALAQKIH